MMNKAVEMDNEERDVVLAQWSSCYCLQRSHIASKIVGFEEYMSIISSLCDISFLLFLAQLYR